MKIVLAPGDTLAVAFQDGGVTTKSTVYLRYSEDQVLALDSPWPDSMGRSGVVYDSTRNIPSPVETE